MSIRACLILERQHDWFINVADDIHVMPKSASVADLVATVSKGIGAAKLGNPKCIIAPASNSCFFARLSLEPDVEIRDRPALMYELENHIPIDAESMAADFIAVQDNGVTADDVPRQSTQQMKSISAVAVDVAHWKPLADALETEGILVTTISPSVALAVSSVTETDAQDAVAEIIFCDGDRADIVTLTNGVILAWKHQKLDITTLTRHRLLDTPATANTLVVGCDTEQADLIREVYGQIDINSVPLETHYSRGALLALSDRTTNGFNLRRDHLAPDDPLRPIARQVNWVAYSAAICLLTMIAGSWWRSERIEREINEVLKAQSAVFRQSFPDTKVPASLMRRVRSEHSRIMGSRNASNQIDVPKPAVQILRGLLTSLPEDVRFRISEIDIRNGAIDIDLQVRRPVDAGVIAESLSKGGFEVAPPVTTQKDAKTFDSFLEAKWPRTRTANKNSEPPNKKQRVTPAPTAAEVSTQ